MPKVIKAITRANIEACYSIMAQLRPHLNFAKFFSQIEKQMRDGYHLACVMDGNKVCAVTGYRIGENLAWGRFMYVDDLVTDENSRSLGYGKLMLDWLKDEARENDCSQLHLDSGFQRLDAHRFYQRERVEATGYHFAIDL